MVISTPLLTLMHQRCGKETLQNEELYFIQIIGFIPMVIEDEK